MGKEKRADVYLEVRKRRGHIFFEIVVRQGRILSTNLYKIFVQDLLLELEENSLGYHLGNVYIGMPTCADDVALIERDSNNLQIMINVISRYAKQHHLIQDKSDQNQNT